MDQRAQLSSAQAAELIARRRRQILIHSALYYRMNESIISDHVYDQWTKQLADLQQQHPAAAQAAAHAEAFKDFDGSTGFDLPINEPDILNRAQHVLAWHKKQKKKPGEV